jgi:hypothetical protein
MNEEPSLIFKPNIYIYIYIYIYILSVFFLTESNKFKGKIQN